VEPRTSLRALALAARAEISHETNLAPHLAGSEKGGTLHEHLRGARKSCPGNAMGRYDSRGRLAGKRMIGERPARVAGPPVRSGIWEIDTMMGESQGESSHCVPDPGRAQKRLPHDWETPARTAAETNAALLRLMAAPSRTMRTITADNGTEFHWYGQVEAVHPVKFYFATPPSQLGRGTNENTNDSSGSTCPKEKTMARITQSDAI